MSTVCVKAEHLSKTFLIPKKRGRAFGVFRSWLKKDQFYSPVPVLRDVSFDIHTGDKIALIGENGSGKTTLLRILSGIYTANSGCIQVHGTVNIFLKTGAGVYNDLSVIDNTYVFGALYGMERRVLRRHIDDIICFAGLDDLRYCPEKELSAGQAQRHIISVILTVFSQGSDKCLVFDDSLAFVDTSFLKKCQPRLQELFNSRKTIIAASHNHSLLRQYCTRAIWLDRGIIRMDGDITRVLEAYEQFDSGNG